MRSLTLSVLVATASLAADPMPPKVERLTYRVVGLSSPEREAALRKAFEGERLADFKLIGIDFTEAEITLEFAPQKLFPNQKPERVAEIIGERLQGETGGLFKVKPRRTLPRDKLVPVEIPVAGCHCKACDFAAYQIVAEVDGVEHATVSFKDGKVLALLDPAKADKEKLVAALRKRDIDVKLPAPAPKK